MAPEKPKTEALTRKSATTKPPPSRITPLLLILTLILPLLSALAVYTTLYQARQNGTLPIIKSILKAPKPLLPTTLTPLLRRYTRLPPLDRQLSVLVTFFSPVVDPRNKELFLLAIAGLGQFGGAWAIMLLESLRVGNKGLAITYIALTGLIFQNLTYAFTIPIWILIYLWTSPLTKSSAPSKASLLVPSHDLIILPVSIGIGYILPTLLMALPTPLFISPLTHQKFLAVWQFFPIITTWLHQRLPHFIDPPEDLSPLSAKDVYKYVLAGTAITHMPVAGYALFTGTFNKILCPPFPIDVKHQVGNLAEGVHTFLVWDVCIGGVAFLVWAVLQWWNTMVAKRGGGREMRGGWVVGKKGEGVGQGLEWKLQLLVDLLIRVSLGMSIGMIGVVALLLMERDSVVLAGKEEGEEKDE